MLPHNKAERNSNNLDFWFKCIFEYPTKKNQYQIQKDAYPNIGIIKKDSAC